MDSHNSLYFRYLTSTTRLLQLPDAEAGFVFFGEEIGLDEVVEEIRILSTPNSILAYIFITFATIHNSLIL